MAASSSPAGSLPGEAEEGEGEGPAFQGQMPQRPPPPTACLPAALRVSPCPPATWVRGSRHLWGDSCAEYSQSQAARQTQSPMDAGTPGGAVCSGPALHTSLPLPGSDRPRPTPPAALRAAQYRPRSGSDTRKQGCGLCPHSSLSDAESPLLGRGRGAPDRSVLRPRVQRCPAAHTPVLVLEPRSPPNGPPAGANRLQQGNPPPRFSSSVSPVRGSVAWDPGVQQERQTSVTTVA